MTLSNSTFSTVKYAVQTAVSGVVFSHRRFLMFLNGNAGFYSIRGNTTEMTRRLSDRLSQTIVRVIMGVIICPILQYEDLLLLFEILYDTST